MKHRISPYNFSSYRDFLREALKENGFSYRTFAAKHGEIISYIMLAQTLTRGKSGTENRPMRNISPETLARIGKVFKLRDDEITYLVLLKLENDSGALPGLHGYTYMDVIKGLLREQKRKITHRDRKISKSRERHSQTAETIAEFFDLLPDGAKHRLSRELLVEGKGVLSRHKRKAGVKSLASTIQRLERLVNAGTP